MNNKKVLAGAKLAGGNPENGRVEDDYYATNPEAVKMLLTKYTFDAHTILEPCVGGGHIANAINDFYTTKREITGMDLVDRGYPGTIVADFLTYKTDKKYEGIITNPPYGERLEEKEALPALYREIGESFRRLDKWSMYLITSYDHTENDIGKKADKNRKIYNGMLKTYYYQFLGPKPPKRRKDS